MVRRQSSRAMPVHDIIDNRAEKLVTHIKSNLDSSRAAHFAVGYFFLSGLENIVDRLEGIRELRILIGNTTNRETIEQIVEGYQRLDLAEQAVEAQIYPRKLDSARMTTETAEHI